MKISAKRILNIKKWLARIPGNSDFRFAFSLPQNHKDILQKIGFPENIINGATVLPVAIGPVSSLNADGKYVPLKDLPKESRYVTTIEWTWEQWSGYYGTETVTEERDIWKDCYQRKFIPPPAVELTYSEQKDKSLVISPTFNNRADMHEKIRHTMNLMLELFGECEILQADLKTFEDIPVRRVNWRILPPGKYPWDRVNCHITNVLRDRDERYSNVIFNRHETIKRYEPDEVYVGEGGFERYVAYVFQSRGIVVLECTEKDNAIYIFGNDWQTFSKLTKAQVLSNDFHLARIVHNKDWRAHFDKLMNNPTKKKPKK